MPLDTSYSVISIPVIKYSEDSKREKNLEYMALEVAMKDEYYWTANFWSLGVLAFEMCYHWNPLDTEYGLE